MAVACGEGDAIDCPTSVANGGLCLYSYHVVFVFRAASTLIRSSPPPTNTFCGGTYTSHHGLWPRSKDPIAETRNHRRHNTHTDGLPPQHVWVAEAHTSMILAIIITTAITYKQTMATNSTDLGGILCSWAFCIACKHQACRYAQTSAHVAMGDYTIR